MGLQRTKHVFNRLRERIRDAYWRTVSPAATVLSQHWGEIQNRNSTGLCLFSTFDPGGRIDPYVQRYIRDIRACGFDVAVITTSPSLHPADVEALRPYARIILHRKNIGIDFGSWRAATQIIKDWEDYDRLLLTNDSIYGPLSDLNEVLERCAAEDADVVGLTDNLEITWHLQSYFLYIKKNVLGSDTFKAYLRSIRLHLDKYVIIDKYEVGFSRMLLAAGFGIRALYPFEAVREFVLKEHPEFPYRDKLSHEPLNQTLYMWDPLVRTFKFPFIKTEILKINRMQLPEIAGWRSLIPEHKAEWRGLIENHLRRVFPEAAGLKF